MSLFGGGDDKAPAIDPATGKPRKGIFGRFADRARARQDEAAAKAEADKLVNTTPVAPPATALLASVNSGLAQTAAERTRKRAAGGGLLLHTPATPGPKAKLAPKSLLGY